MKIKISLSLLLLAILHANAVRCMNSLVESVQIAGRISLDKLKEASPMTAQVDLLNRLTPDAVAKTLKKPSLVKIVGNCFSAEDSVHEAFRQGAETYGESILDEEIDGQSNLNVKAKDLYRVEAGEIFIRPAKGISRVESLESQKATKETAIEMLIDIEKITAHHLRFLEELNAIVMVETVSNYSEWVSNVPWDELDLLAKKNVFSILKKNYLELFIAYNQIILKHLPGIHFLKTLNEVLDEKARLTTIVTKSVPYTIVGLVIIDDLIALKCWTLIADALGCEFFEARRKLETMNDEQLQLLERIVNSTIEAKRQARERFNKMVATLSLEHNLRILATKSEYSTLEAEDLLQKMTLGQISTLHDQALIIDSLCKSIKNDTSDVEAAEEKFAALFVAYCKEL